MITHPAPQLLFPGALWQPLVGHSNPGTLEQKKMGVIHSAEGGTASGVFATFTGSRYPNRVSAHFCVDRAFRPDGSGLVDIFQFLPLTDIAWHASAVNSISIGIEHATMSQEGADDYNRSYASQIEAGSRKPFLALPMTDAQYHSSARLIAWLSKVLKIPCDREHWKGHQECSPQDHHVLCCSGAIDADRLIALASGIAVP